MMTLFHPVIMIGSLLGLLFGALAIRGSGAVQRIGLGFLAFLCFAPAAFLVTAIHPELVDARFRVYKAFYQDIHEGMTRDDIESILARHYPPTGPRQRPKVMDDTSDQLGFFMNPETSREPNCEGIFLTLQDGRVVGKDYSPD